MTDWSRIPVKVLLLLVAAVNAAVAEPKRTVPAAEPKRVLVIHSFGRDFAPWNAVGKSLRVELAQQSPNTVDIFEASLATARSDDDQEAPFVDYLRALFAKRQLDLIMTIGAPAAGFVQRHRPRLFPSTPALFIGLEQRRVVRTALTPNDAVVTTSLRFASILENILRLLPETNNLAIVLGNSPIERYWLGQVRDELKPFENRVTLTSLSDLPFEDILLRAAALPPRSAILFGLMLVDAAGIAHEEVDALARLTAVANAPIFAQADVQFGQGVVGGPMTTVSDVTRQAVIAARRILGGETAGNIQIPPIEFGRPRYDWRALKRWNISEARLPAGSEVHFREPTLFEQYRWQMIAVTAAILFQSALIAGLLLERRRRHTVEVDLRRRVLEVAHLNRSATVGVMSASIAHELNQPLGSILLNTETADLLLKDEQIDRRQLEEILAEIRRDDERAARIIKGLAGFLKKKDLDLQSLDLNEALEDALQIIEPVAARRGVQLQIDRVPVALPVRADPVHLHQVVMNLAINAMDAMQDRNGVRRITFRTSRTAESEATVQVSDSGPGIPTDKLNTIFETFYTTKQQGSGLGLSIARTIIELYGGTIWAENRFDSGATFIFTVPLAAGDTA